MSAPIRFSQNERTYESNMELFLKSTGTLKSCLAVRLPLGHPVSEASGQSKELLRALCNVIGFRLLFL